MKTAPGSAALHFLLPGHVPVGIAQEESECGARLRVSGVQRCGIPPAVARLPGPVAQLDRAAVSETCPDPCPRSHAPCIRLLTRLTEAPPRRPGSGQDVGTEWGQDNPANDYE